MKIDIDIDVWLDNSGVELSVEEDIVKSYLLTEMVSDYLETREKPGFGIKIDNPKYVEDEQGEFLRMAEIFEKCHEMLIAAAGNIKQ